MANKKVSSKPGGVPAVPADVARKKNTVSKAASSNKKITAKKSTAADNKATEPGTPAAYHNTVEPIENAANTNPETSRPNNRSSKEISSPESKTVATVDANTIKDISIVGIGSSAGGLEALDAFFDAMPATSGYAFVIVVHQFSEQVSLLTDLLQNHTTMPVNQVTDGTRIAQNHVYITAPGHLLSLNKNCLHLKLIGDGSNHHKSIDSFFYSLAEEKLDNAIGIVLSGSGSDGSDGLMAIKSYGGLTLVQDPATAKYAEMPANAIDTALIDYVLPPGELPAALPNLQQQTKQSDSVLEENQNKNKDLYTTRILSILSAKTGHDFSEYKKNTIQRRIQRRIKVNQFKNLYDYYAYLRKSEVESSILFSELLIGVTSLFRDIEQFDYLRTIALPKFIRNKNSDEQLRIWVSACSTGEEAYSMAITVNETIEELGLKRDFVVFATDINESAIDSARKGIYPAKVAEDLEPKLLDKYFVKLDKQTYQIKKFLREKLIFAIQNIVSNPPFTRMDMLSCRNLMIYLEPQLQRRLLHLFHYSLVTGGILILGTSETASSVPHLFTAAQRKVKIYNAAVGEDTINSLMLRKRLPQAGTGGKQPSAVSSISKPTQQASPLELIKSILQESNTQPCVIIDDTFDILYIHGRTGRYLEPAEGQARLNLLDMARPGLKSPIAAAARDVSIHRQEVTRKDIEIDFHTQTFCIDLTIRPVIREFSQRTLMLVIFTDATSTNRNKSESQSQSSDQGSEDRKQLRLELQRANETLQTTIEELETTNEELKSSNEELQSTFEESQSTNEELETSKEEMESLNEESLTVNVELQARIDELSKTNNDLRNLLDSSELGTIFLDLDLNIRRYTPRAMSIFPFVTSDHGRPLNNLVSTIPNLDLNAMCEQVLADMTVVHCTVKSLDNHTYSLRVRPYRTTSNIIDGVVITFEDITAQVITSEELKRSETRFRKLFSDSTDAQLILTDGSYSDCNEAALILLGATREQLIGNNPGAMAPKYQPDGRLSTDAVRDNIKIMVTNGQGLFEWYHQKIDGTPFWAEVVATCVEIDNKESILAIWRDITDRKVAASELAKSENRSRALLEMSNDSVVMIDPETQLFSECNKNAHDLLGYSAGEFRKLGISDIETCEQQQKTGPHKLCSMQEGDHAFTTRHIDKRGVVSDVEGRTRVVVNGNSRLILSTWRIVDEMVVV